MKRRPDFMLVRSKRWENALSMPGGGWRAGTRSAKPTSPSSTIETMMATLSPKRLALLKHVRRHPASSVSELAKTLGRDYKRVHVDVSALVQAGLIVRDEKGIRAPYDSIQATVSLSA